MDRIDQFKKKRFAFQSEEARTIRAIEVEKRRKQLRTENITRNRFADNLDDSVSNVFLSQKTEPEDAQTSNRMKQLIKWKAEKELKKKLEAQKKKPPFLVGIPHNKPWPATAKNLEVVDCHRGHKILKTIPKVPPRVTRATVKRLAEKQQLPDKPKENIVLSKPLKATKPESRQVNKKKRLSITKAIKDEIVPMIISSQHQGFKAPKGIQPIKMMDADEFPAATELRNHINDIVKNSFVFRMSDRVDHNRITFNDTDKCTPRKSLKALNTSDSVDENFVTPNKNEGNVNNVDDNPAPATFSPFITTKRGKSNARDEQRERLGLNNSSGSIIPTKENIDEFNKSTDDPETAQYYRYLLNKKTEELQTLCETWQVVQNDSDTPEDGHYIINQAIGQTNLLINKKFRRFENLVSDCEKGDGQMLVTSKDLQGFWEMMSMEITNCHTRFENLEKLKSNSWVEAQPEMKKTTKVTRKRTATKNNKVSAKSSVKAFIEAKRKLQEKKADVVDDEILAPENIQLAKADNLEVETPDLRLNNSFQLKSNQTPGKSILKQKIKDNKTNDLNKSTTKVNFNDTIVINDDHVTTPFDKKQETVYKSTNSINDTKLSKVEMNESVVSPKILRSRTCLNKNNNTKRNGNILNLLKDTDTSLLSTPRKTPKKSLKDQGLMKENNNTPFSDNHPRRSARKSIRLTSSDECTACINGTLTPRTPKTPRKSRTRFSSKVEDTD